MERLNPTPCIYIYIYICVYTNIYNIQVYMDTYIYGLVSKVFCAAFKEIPQVYVPVRSLWGLQVKKYAHVSARLLPVFLPHPCNGLCLHLLPLASPPLGFTPTPSQVTRSVRSQYVPSTFRVRSDGCLFWIFFVPQSWSGLPFCPSCLPLYSPLMCVHGLVSVLHRAPSPRGHT